ncbi:MAG: metal-dependent hydrolase, partial [Candidatus Micropelagos thuwalensis]|nr:metal-dependent hydrolase [Candidatus Micropelagos thuwalensis]
MTIMGRPSLCDVTDKSTDRVSIGHVKLHYHDHDLPSLETLTQEIQEAHAQGRGVASHCVTHAELMLTLAAIEAAGPSEKDRIEHAAIVTQDALDWIKQLNIGVVTQPNFIVAREQAY